MCKSRFMRVTKFVWYANVWLNGYFETAITKGSSTGAGRVRYTFEKKSGTIRVVHDVRWKIKLYCYRKSFEARVALVTILIHLKWSKYSINAYLWPWFVFTTSIYQNLHCMYNGQLLILRVRVYEFATNGRKLLFFAVKPLGCITDRRIQILTIKLFAVLASEFCALNIGHSS